MSLSYNTLLLKSQKLWNKPSVKQNALKGPYALKPNFVTTRVSALSLNKTSSVTHKSATKVRLNCVGDYSITYDKIHLVHLRRFTLSSPEHFKFSRQLVTYSLSKETQLL